MKKIASYFVLSFFCSLSLQAESIQKIPSYHKDELPVVKSSDEFNKLFPSLNEYFKNEKAKNVSRIFVIRHGESLSNKMKLEGVRLVDTNITKAGEDQAAEVANNLMPGIDEISGVYITPMKRTQQTADAIAQVWREKKGKNIPKPVVVPELDERKKPARPSTPQEKLQSEKNISKLKKFEDKFSYKIQDDEESHAEVYQRVVPAILNIAKNHINQNVLVVTHSGVMRTLLIGAAASGEHPVALEWRSFELPNAAVIVIESDGKTYTVKAINDLSYRP